MREIKFRQRIDQVEVANTILEATWHYWGYIDGRFIMPLSGDSAKDSYQYTGLKDKNGVEIYEGDILRGSSSMGYINFKEVIWEQSKLRFYCYPQGRADRDWFDRVSTVEIIGNIYSNPDLLEKKL